MIVNVFLFICLVNSCCCCVYSCLYMNLGTDENGISFTCYPLLKIITKWCGAEKSQKKTLCDLNGQLYSTRLLALLEFDWWSDLVLESCQFYPE